MPPTGLPEERKVVCSQLNILYLLRSQPPKSLYGPRNINEIAPAKRSSFIGNQRCFQHSIHLNVTLDFGLQNVTVSLLNWNTQNCSLFCLNYLNNHMLPFNPPSPATNRFSSKCCASGGVLQQLSVHSSCLCNSVLDAHTDTAEKKA